MEYHLKKPSWQRGESINILIALYELRCRVVGYFYT